MTGETKRMMYLETPPKLIQTEVFSAMPDTFRRKGTRTRSRKARSSPQAQR